MEEKKLTNNQSLSTEKSSNLIRFINGDFVTPSWCENEFLEEIPISARPQGSPVDGEEFVLTSPHKESYKNRDLLEKAIRRRGYSFPRQKNYFKLHDAIRDELVNRGCVEDPDSPKLNHAFTQKQAFNFQHCGSQFGVGEFRVGTNGAGDLISQSAVYRCGSKYCMSCRERERKRALKKYCDYFFQFRSFSTVYRFQFTLPQEISSLLINGDGVIDDEHIIQMIIKTVRTGFGRKTRSNMPILISRHIVGDSGGFFRSHLHYHVICCPFEIGKMGKYSDGLTIKSFAGGHLDDSHLTEFGNIFASYLRQCYSFNTVNRPNCSYLQRLPSTMENGELTKKEIEKQQAITSHKVLYDNRSFVSDLRKSFPFSDARGAYFREIRKKTVDGEEVKELKYIYHDVSAIVDKMLFVFQNARYYPYGILTNMKRLDSIFKYFEEESLVVDVLRRDTALISRRFNARSGERKTKTNIDEYITIKDTDRPVFISHNMSSGIDFIETLKVFGPVGLYVFYQRQFNFSELKKVIDNTMFFKSNLTGKVYTEEIKDQERALFKKFLGKTIPFRRTVKVTELRSFNIPLVLN